MNIFLKKNGQKFFFVKNFDRRVNFYFPGRTKYGFKNSCCTAPVRLVFSIALHLIGATNATAQNVGIGTTSPNPKAILDIQSTNQGVLFPRITTVQRNLISNPPDGLQIYNTDERCFNYYDSLNALWNCFCSS